MASDAGRLCTDNALPVGFANCLRHFANERWQRIRWIARLLVLNLGTAGIAIAGGRLLLAHFGGLCWLVVTVIVSFAWAPINVWALVIRAARDEMGHKTDAGGAS